ncbi:MAG: response regulator [Methanoregula sp.]|nr:response regulator [Methanoregula sp.]
MKKESILIVEDDFIVAKVIEKNLIDLGFSIAGLVATGEDAIAKAGSEKPDLVLMDIHLQGEMDGIAASEKISARFNIPVVFLTAFSDQQTFDRALVTAPFGYIIKPFSQNTLSATIRVALNKKHVDQKITDRHIWLDSTVSSLPEGIITIDAEGKIVLVNLAAEQMTGWTNKEAFGQSLDQVLIFIDPISGQSFHYYITPIIQEGIIGTIPDDSFVISKNMTRLLIEESFATPIRNGNAQIGGAVIVLYPKTAIPGSGDRAQETDLADFPDREISIAFENQKGRIREPSVPVDTAGWYDRGNYLLFLRRYRDAINAYENAISMNALNYQSWYGKGTALLKLGNVQDALVAYDQALSIFPRNSRILDAKGMLLKKIGNDKEAERCFELARLYQA